MSTPARADSVPIRHGKLPRFESAIMSEADRSEYAPVATWDHVRSAVICASVFGATLLMLVFPAISRAGCGGVETAAAATHLPGQLPPLAIGDSTMLLSLPGLAADGYDANAHGCRQLSEALALLAQLRARHALPNLVALALGANGYVTSSDIGQVLHVLCCNRLLVLVTPRQLGGSAGPNAALEHAEARAHPSQILLLDWVKYSAGHPDWFQPDGLHLTLPGVHAFTNLLARALPYAYLTCPPIKRAGRLGRPMFTADSWRSSTRDRSPARPGQR